MCCVCIAHVFCVVRTLSCACDCVPSYASEQISLTPSIAWPQLCSVLTLFVGLFRLVAFSPCCCVSCVPRCRCPRLVCSRWSALMPFLWFPFWRLCGVCKVWCVGWLWGLSWRVAASRGLPCRRPCCVSLGSLAGVMWASRVAASGRCVVAPPPAVVRAVGRFLSCA